MLLPKKTFEYAPKTKNGEGFSGHDIIQLMHLRGLGTLTYKGEQKNHYVVKIRASVKLLEEVAEKYQYKMELDPQKLKEATNKGSEGISPFEIAKTPLTVSWMGFHPYDYHFVPFNTSPDIKP